MNIRLLTAALALISTVSVTAWSQDTGQSGTSTNNPQTSSSSTGAGQDRAATRDQAPAPDPAEATPSVPASAEPWSTSAATTTITGLGGIHRLSPDELKHRVTASSLIGKEIVDRDGQTVGTIKDVGLTQVLPLHLQSTTDEVSNATMRAPGVTPPDATKTTRAESNPMAGTNPMQPGGTQEVHLLVQVRGELGKEEDLLVIPASQVWQVEDTSQRYRLAMSNAELRNAADLTRSGTAPAE